MRLGLVILMLACATPTLAGPAPTPPAEVEAKPAASKKACLSAAETREEIKGHGLREPFAALKFASQHFKAEALSAKLCRIDDEFVYEIALLHKDGRYFHAYVNATTGKLVDAKRLAVTPPKT
jgi:uncharacterized membrane protein YkoI